MENASKALIIAGAILLSILIIAIGMYIYTSSHNSISEAGSQISEQEKTSFNQQWNTYEGAQGGNNVKALLQKLIANCNTNAQEDQRLVDVELGAAADTAANLPERGISSNTGLDKHRFIPIGAFTHNPAATIADYDSLKTSRGTGVTGDTYSPDEAVKALQIVRNGIEARHTYTVSISYSPKSSLVDMITIVY